MTDPRRSARLQFSPWAGWFGGVLGWFGAHQAGTYIAQAACSANPWIVPGIGLVGALIALAGASISLAYWRHSSDADAMSAAPRRFLALSGSIAAGLFVLAIIFQTMSAFIIPRCFA